MIAVHETAVRAWVDLPRKRRRRVRSKRQIPWRSAPFGKRVLIFDTETATDFLQWLLFGVFRLYDCGQLVQEGIILGDSLSADQIGLIQQYAIERDLPFFNRMAFCKEIFYPEIYIRGTLCVGFNLPFDLSRIAVKAGARKGGRRFRLTLTDWHSNPAIHIEPISGRAAFIEFALKKNLRDWEKPYFKGRFLDLSTLVNALTGKRFSLRRAAMEFQTSHRKTKAELGIVSVEALDYCRNDVLVTAELYERLLEEYLCYPFASMANERNQPDCALSITRIYSTASIAKATLRMMGFRSLLDEVLK
jgi:hypothetical protein